MFSFTRRTNYRSTSEKKIRFRPRLEALEDRSLLSGGVLDPTFGSGGVVNTPVNAGPYNAVGTATYPNEGTANDGKIVAATVAFGSKNGQPYMAVARYNLNGTLDNTFAGTGEAMTVNGYARGVAVQPDGKVVVAGWTPRGDFAVLRYNPNGSLDTSFGAKGEAVVKFGIYGSYAYNVALQADGKIVLAGEAYDGTSWDVGLARLNTNGSLDTSFGSSGEVVTPLPYSLYGPDYRFNVTNLAIDPNTSASDPNSGKLVVAVRSPQPAGVVVRYNTNGTLDTTFGGGTGYVNLGREDRLAVVVQSDDRTVVAGNGSGIIYLARLNADGTLDASFGSGGIVLTPPPPNDGVFADCVALQANGQILAGGFLSLPSSPSYGLMAARWNADGSVDTTFGSGGFALASGTGQGTAMALEPDGRIVVAGKNVSSGGIELVRFLAAGPLFTANPNPVPAGSNLTLTASNFTDANPGASITGVAFYVDSNGDGVLEPGADTLLGYATPTGPGTWKFTFFTTGLTAGTYTFFAVAEDSLGAFSDPLRTTEQVL
jgi:uncharacterized delta-60 repeat protein